MATPKARILVVDDEEGIRELLKDILEEEGYICLTAGSGLEALQFTDSEAVDLALVDMIMPGINGATLFQLLRGLYPDLAVVFITAVSDVDLAVEHLRVAPLIT